MADESSFEFEYQFSSSGNGATRPSKDFKRSYQACLSCRKMKAKCIVLESSDTCTKCQRERRECVFTAERSVRTKRKNEDDTSNRYQHTTKRPRTRRTGHSDSRLEKSENVLNSQANDDIKADLDREVMRTVVASSNDALGLLFRAAEQQENSEDTDDIPVVDHAQPEVTSPVSAVTSSNTNIPLRFMPLSCPSEEVIQVWEAFRFVKMGWFSALEAVTYIDLFFQNLCPLTPILTPFFSNHQNHAILVSREPLLCCTLLLISSRYHVLSGTGGISRAQHIHSRLWRHCERLVQRITFGQEKYSVAKTRTLGSIEALLLITEWNPRALHFPPEEDGWDASLAPDIEVPGQKSTNNEDANLRRWREEVFEPAKRSDWMSWMMLGLATTLAHELGVFEGNERGYSGEETNFYKLRIRRLLFIYVNQLAFRLGCTSLLPQSSFQSSLEVSENLAQLEGQHIGTEKLTMLWIEITKLLKTATEMFFPSRSFTAQLLESGRYIGLLEHFQPLLLQWKEKFDSCKEEHISSTSRSILSIEYQYVRMYINSLAIQALVERANARGTSALELDLEILRLEHRQDYKFTQEVTEASVEILQKAIHLADTENLALAPVRVFLRISSASIFLLKAISLGARKVELEKYLDIFDRCINALRSKTLDDIHLSARYATLIERLVKRFRQNFRVRSQPNNGSLISASIQNQAGPTGTTSGATENGLSSFAASHEVTSLTNTDLAFDDWLSQPFDPAIAPFGLGSAQTMPGFEVESLDFLWNLDEGSPT